MTTRRALLRAMGMGTALLGTGGLALRRALAGPAQAPRRLIVISHCQGWPYEGWKIRPGQAGNSALGPGTPWKVPLFDMARHTFSPILQPLYPHRARLTALDGLSLASAETDIDGYRHAKGWIHAWTGNHTQFDGSVIGARSASIDQLVAANIGRADRLPSLELCIGTPQLGEVLLGGRPIAHSVNGAPLPMETEASRAWDRTYGAAADPSAAIGAQQAAMSAAHREYRRLSPGLTGEDRAKLDTHFDLLSRLGDRLEGMASLSCPTPPQPTDPLSFDDRFDALCDIIAGALSCDITRVVSLSLGDLQTEEFGWDGYTDDVHVGIAHQMYANPECEAALTDYVRTHAKQVARLVSLLEQTPDIDGRSVMDNTLIVWGSELADGWHGYRHYCPVLIGGDWHFETGWYHYWPHRTPIELLVPELVSPSGYIGWSGLPHQHMLVSVARAMGLDVNAVGLTHADSARGTRIDLRGPLPFIG